VFVAIGAAQVGMSSTSGIRVLRYFKGKLGRIVSIWPFDEIEDKRSVIVEIFPRYFACLKGLSANMSDCRLLNEALLAYESEPVKKAPDSEDEGDALLSAAALRCLSKSGMLFRALDPAARQEGWIFGVPFEGAR
jgi:hypothetical protein